MRLLPFGLGKRVEPETEFAEPQGSDGNDDRGGVFADNDHTRPPAPQGPRADHGYSGQTFPAPPQPGGPPPLPGPFAAAPHAGSETAPGLTGPAGYSPESGSDLGAYDGRRSLAVGDDALDHDDFEAFDGVPDTPTDGWLGASGIEKTYGRKHVVKGVSLAVQRGESVGLLGPNGAGKTTVFYMITGLVAADKGKVFIDDEDVTKLPMYRRARLGIGYLPQESSIFRGLSVEDNIMAVLEIVEPNRRKRKAELDSLLEEFRITRLRKSPSIALSGGERRRCEIARALASRPSYILLDEPFAGIDPLAVGDIQALVRHLTQRGIGVLITDHNVRETLSLIDRAYIIYDGRVLTQGSPQDIVNDDDVRRVYLGDMFNRDVDAAG